MHVVWLNDRANLEGGAERYVFETAQLLRSRGHRSSLLYDPEFSSNPTVLSAFDAAFPAVDVPAQIRALGGDVVYAHQIGRERVERALGVSPAPVVRFFHDHRLF